MAYFQGLLLLVSGRVTPELRLFFVLMAGLCTGGLFLGYFHQESHVSSVENPGWLFDIGDDTTQLYGDYNKPI